MSGGSGERKGSALRSAMPAPSGNMHPHSGAALFWDVIENKDSTLINNRQAGRRRGRNNSRPQGNGRGGDSGNRIDNRARGNATQLLEKYKNLARDAQTQGDRVNAEYYLQFADHYFRVLADNRARQEEQQGFRRNRDDNRFDGEDDYDGEGEGGLEQGVGDDFGAQDDMYRPQQRYNERQPEQRQVERQNDRQGERQHERSNERQNDRQGERQFERGPRRARRPRDEEAAPVQAPSAQGAEAAPAAPASTLAAEESVPKVKRAPRKRAPREEVAEESHGLDVAILPPSISRADNDSDAEEAPRKRTRRVRPAAEAAE